MREIVHGSIGGLLVRVRLSNAYGKEALGIGAAHIGNFFVKRIDFSGDLAGNAADLATNAV